jgi:ABC-type xylose transport system permease subunit
MKICLSIATFKLPVWVLEKDSIVNVFVVFLLVELVILFYFVAKRHYFGNLVMLVDFDTIY